MGFFEKVFNALGSHLYSDRCLARLFFSNAFQVIGNIQLAKINLPVAALIWLMIIPMMIKIDLKALKEVKQFSRDIGVTLFVNWAVKPFSMALLGWLFIGYLFKPYLPQDQIESYIAGLIILAAAPCTAMVFVWSNLMDGEPHFTLSQVALNDVIMIFYLLPLSVYYWVCHQLLFHGTHFFFPSLYILLFH